ncbi:MAG: prephenate/arogenate dehydrogenase family protein [Alphaproteobacteria bacterium]
MFQKIAIIGQGLIGSSLTRALRRADIAGTLVAADIDSKVCERVRALGYAHEVTSDIQSAVVGADMVVLAVPVGACGAVGEIIGAALRPGAVVTDTGSVKQAVIDALKPHIPESVHLVPGHPIAGTEHSGPEAGFAELFEGRWSILTPLPDSDIRAVEKVTALWESCGAKIEIMSPQHHDLVLGITSHLPHLIAYTIVGTANQLEDDMKSEVIKFSASGFRDFTRIAASDPVMWRDVFLNNKNAVLEILQRFSEDLTAMQKAIRRGDGQFLFDTFSNTRDIRRQIIDLGQANYVAPGGVRPEDTPPVEVLHKSSGRSG